MNCSPRRFRSPVFTRKSYKALEIVQSNIPQEASEKMSFSMEKRIGGKEGTSGQETRKMECLTDNGKNKERKKENSLGRRTNTVLSVFRKNKSREKEDALSSKSFSAPSRALGSERMPASASAHERETRAKSSSGKAKLKNKSERFENLGSCSLLSVAVSEQESVIERLQATKEELRRKVKEEAENRCSEACEGAESGRGFAAEPRSGFLDFEDLYRSTLEDIFQVWIHLFYFIINLKLNVPRLLDSGSEDLKRVEAEVILQAIECAKFFSRLKLNAIENSFDDFWIPTEHYFTETQMKDCEEQVLCPFFLEMEFIQRKAKEIVVNSQKESTLSVRTYCD